MELDKQPLNVEKGFIVQSSKPVTLRPVTRATVIA